MDRNLIFSGLMSSYEAYSSTDTRPTIEKVLKYSGGSSDLSQRADIKREVAIFRLRDSNTGFLIEDNKPIEITQVWDVLIYVEQGDSHSIKEARYDRMLEISDQIIDWSVDVSPALISPDLYTVTLDGLTAVEENNGYLSTILTFNSIIRIQ